MTDVIRKTGFPIMILLGLLLAACAQSTTTEPVDQQPQDATNERTIFVGPVLVDCEGEGPQKCMLVKENPEDEYQLFYDQIDGFEYQEGFEYQMVVKSEEVENPPAGGSSIKWSLVEIVDKQPVPVAGEGELKTVYVGSKLQDCVGVAPQKCMQVKESPEEEYTLFYDQIEGFEYEEGYEYKLLVQEEQVENPPADGSSIRWILVSIESKEAVGEPGTGQLEGTEWILNAYLNQGGELVEPLAGTFTSAKFNSGEINGNAGCNNYFGGYKVDGTSISIGPLASTEMFCGNPPGVMDQETAFLSAMNSSAEYKIEAEQLILLDASGETLLVFEVAEPLVLPGSQWNVLMYNNGKEAVVSVILGTEITANFGEDGRLTGNAGCNNYSAAYEIDGDQITIGPAISTRMACGEPEGVMEQEMAYLAALEVASSYQFEDQQRLILLDSEGHRVVDYKPARNFKLTETIWNLENFNIGGDAIAPVLEGTEITAYFDEDGNVSGTAGCNNYSGSYKVEGEQITIELGPLTMMFCEQPEGTMDQETAYLQALDSVATFRILGDEMVMLNEAGQEVLIYKASDLVGTVWMWTEFQENNDTVTHPNMPGNYTLEFMPDGQVAVQADCNRASGTYTVDGNQLDIEIMVSTMAACPEGSLADEYIQLLNDAVAYIREGDLLYIDIMMDAGTMKFFPLE
ncbi:MAG: META domain-containing protein [Anaerolineales bacterium]